MTTASKSAIILSVLLCVELIAFGNLVSTTPSAAQPVSSLPVMAVSDAIYVPSAKEEAAEEEAAKKEAAQKASEEVAIQDNVATEEVVAEDEISYDYTDDDVVYEDYDYNYDPDLIPYDGSGYYNANVDGNWHQGSDFAFDGVYKDGCGYSFTYYPESVLPGGGLNIPGRHVGDEGYVCDGDDNICIASDDLPPGTVVSVPFGNGTGVVYDSGSGHGNLDLYVSW